MRPASFYGGGELDSALKNLGDRKKTVQTLRESLEAGKKMLSRLVDEKKALEAEIVTLRASRASALREKDEDLAAFARKNKALLESIENLKEDAKNIEAQKKKLARQKIPKELRDKIRDFGAR